MSPEVGQLALGEVALAADAVHDLQRPILVHVASGRPLHPGDEVVHLGRAGAVQSASRVRLASRIQA